MLIESVYIPEYLWSGIYQTGSSVICNPPVNDTDIDYVICSRDKDPTKLVEFVQSVGFKNSLADQAEYGLDEEGFYCLRRGSINLIVTGEYYFYEKFVVATKLAKKLNLLKKEQRIALFQYVLYGNL